MGYFFPPYTSYVILNGSPFFTTRCCDCYKRKQTCFSLFEMVTSLSYASRLAHTVEKDTSQSKEAMEGPVVCDIGREYFVPPTPSSVGDISVEWLKYVLDGWFASNGIKTEDVDIVKFSANPLNIQVDNISYNQVCFFPAL